LAQWLSDSPLVEVEFLDGPAPAAA
jgi:hypothetical protein